MDRSESMPESLPHGGSPERQELPAAQGTLGKLHQALEPFLPNDEAYDLLDSQDIIPARLGQLEDGRILWLMADREHEGRRNIHIKLIQRSAGAPEQVETDMILGVSPEGYKIGPSYTQMVHNDLVAPRPAEELWEQSLDAVHGAAEAQLLEADMARTDDFSEVEAQELVRVIRGTRPFDPFGD